MRKSESLRRGTAAVLAAGVAGLAAASASAAPPVPRLVYTKAVAYVTAQGKAHGVKVTCAPYDVKNGLYGNATCTFGGKTQLKLIGGAKCRLWAALYAEPPRFAHRISSVEYLTLCRAGWQKELPLPWTIQVPSGSN